MTKEIRQGLGLALVGLVLLLVGVLADGQPGVVIRMGGVLFLIGGLIAAAVGLFRQPQQD